MNIQRSIGLSLAGAIALALYGVASVAAAQPAAQQAAQQQAPPPPAVPQSAPPQTASGQFYQGTETSASYPLPDSNGGTLTVHSGMPGQVKNYGPPPPFKTLDANHDGRITEAEAQAYPPLDSDFLFVSNHGKTISRAQYAQWMKAQH